MRKSAAESRSGERAFSLVEVVVSMVILSLILGSVFGVVWQATDSAAELRILDARDQQVGRFLSLYRGTLESLPVGASVTITPAEESSSGQEEMKIEGATTAYAMGVNSGTDGETIISLRVQAEKPTGDLEDYVGPLYKVAVSREGFEPLVEDGEMAIRVGEGDPFFEIDDEGRYWLPLLDNIVSMSWRYWDAGQREWVETWEEDALPEMLELSLLDPWRPAPLRVVFEIPAHLVQGGGQQSGDGGTAGDSEMTDNGSSNPPATDRPQTGGSPANGEARDGKGRTRDGRPGRGGGGEGGARPGRPGGAGGGGGGGGGNSTGGGAR